MTNQVTRVIGTIGLAALVLGGRMGASEALRWKVVGVPQEAMITGGPWTLEQSGAAVGIKSAGYCDTSGKQVGNPGTERMQPYYFPVVFGRGRHLQGLFDWRPKDTDEGVAAAFSEDAGQTWTFQQLVLQLRTTCPTDSQPDPNTGVTPALGAAPDNSDNFDDDGQGHQYVIRIAGRTLLYTLIRAAGYIDSAPLVIHELNPTNDAPLTGAPDLTDEPTDADNGAAPVTGETTVGLTDPDGILGVVPGSGQNGSPLLIIYEQKILNAAKPGTFHDLLSGNLIPRCGTAGGSGAWGTYYKARVTPAPGFDGGHASPIPPEGEGISANDDVTYLRLAATTDGVHFTDRGILQGLNDPTTLSLTATRWLATAGTILRLEDGRYGLFFSGGNCVDADSDAFHYIGYAESSDLIHWVVINGITNPVISIAKVTVNTDANGVPAVPGAPTTIPFSTPVVGQAQGWFAGRVYAPSVTLAGGREVSVIFAGYHTTKPKFALGDYRTIGRVTLRASDELPAGEDDVVNPFQSQH